MLELSGRPLLATSADRHLFVDRQDELAIVRRSIAAHTNVLLLGSRGSGRTSFLRRLEADLGSTARIAFVEGALATTASEFLSLLRYRLAPDIHISALQDQLAATATAMQSVFKGGTRRILPQGLPGEAERLLAALHDIGQILAGEDAVILVDEFFNPEIMHTLFGRLRDDLWQLPLQWVVAGNSQDRATYLRPPADAFFPKVVTLRSLDVNSSVELLKRRGISLPSEMISEVVRLSQGNPRRLVDLARDAVALDLPAADDTRIRRDRVVSALGSSAERVVAELEANGPASASDELFLARLGWSRSRAAQVLRELERAGLVEGSLDRSEGSRPRKVYALTERLYE